MFFFTLCLQAIICWAESKWGSYFHLKAIDNEGY